MGDLKKLFDPGVIALVGATDEEGTVGRKLLETLLLSKQRKTYPVNPHRDTALGLPCYQTITQVPERIDLAIVATPPGTVPDIVEECGQGAVEGILIISSGFKEMGEEGEKQCRQMAEAGKKYGIRIIGPDSLGFIRPGVDLDASILGEKVERGNIAFVSQGGAPGAAILGWALDAHIGFSFFASLGYMIDVDFGDLIDFLGNDPQTRSILLYMEDVVNARKFISAARGFAHNKPILVVKPGRFKRRASSALFHTGALVSCDQVYDAAFKRAGVVRIKEVGDFLNTVTVLHSKHLPKGPRLAIITNVGWMGVMATDALIELGGRLAALSDDSLSQLDTVLGSTWSRANPIDLMGDAGVDRYQEAITVCLNDDRVDGLLTIYVPQNMAAPEDLARVVAGIAKTAYKPIITVWMGGKRVQRGREILLQNNVPTYETPEEAVKTYLYMVQYKKNLESLYETPAELTVDEAPPKNHLKTLIRRALKEGRTILNEEESKRFLINYGIPTVAVRITQNVEGAISLAKYVGYPVALKILSPDLILKSDVGGVVLDVKSDEQLRVKYAELMRKVGEEAPSARIHGVMVQKMIEKIDYEVILGAKKDERFGPVILFGMGGTGVEIHRDYSIGLAPLNQTLARRMMEETEVSKMLKGYRGKPPADLRQLEHILVCFSNLIADFPEIAEMDVNPVAISDGKPYALDARIIIDPGSLENRFDSQYPHLAITPYPARLIATWRLYDGTEVILRPIKPEDEPLQYEMLRSCSPETLKGRFFQNVRNITHEMLIRLCNIDYDREMAIVAEIKDGQSRRIVGGGRLITESDSNHGEFAVIVHDEFQGKGLGYKLCDILIGIAQEKGLEKFSGYVLTDNKKMVNLVRKLGFITEPMPDGVTRVELFLK